MDLFKRSLVAKGAEEVHGKDSWLDNDDLRPLKLKDRTWTAVTYFTFWFSAAATVSNWYGSSTGQALGLSMWESLVCSLGGQILIAVIITVNGRPGATYHVGFPIINRAAFGVFGAWWPTFNRAVMAIVWNGVNAVQGGQCVYVMLHAIFPSIARIPNTMGSGSALTSGGMIGFFIFWFVTCFFLVIPVPKMRVLVYAKLVVFIVSAIAMLGWTVGKAGGLGPVARQGSTVHGSEKAWLIIRFFMLGAANCATFASNAADFQRYAKKPFDVVPGNLIGFPLANFVVSLVGNLVCASSQIIFGELIWNPVDFLDQLQTQDYTAANRAGCFLIAFCFAYSAIFSSIFENSLPAGNDIAALFPKYLTVRKGFFICAIVSFAINPWYLLGSASIFVSFMSSYQIFLSSITGVLLVNYYLIARGYLQMPDLFTSSKTGVYYYTHGWNIRAYIAYVLGVIPNFYGFLNNMGVSAPIGVTRFYYFAYWVGLFVSGLSFWIGCKVKPPAIMNTTWQEPKNYIRPEEEPGVTALEGVEGVEEVGSEDIGEKKGWRERIAAIRG
ncbi:putative uridine permease [Phaeomoniella chlamydospora]|uniref:Putative uridine permease n=1 Tax=Phaeomoniella chlamydospora TaxID=158046 RepID=A0A0G2GAX4_PHACM|nr:putative uridine permease [Phaeomoniella chlamydospora]